MTIGCRFLDPAGPYERTVTGWVDSVEDALLRFSVCFGDGRVDLEVTLVAEPSPSYLVSSGTARTGGQTTGPEWGPLLDAFARVQGLRIVPGFRRQVAGLLGEHPLAEYLLDAAIEAARLSRQVTRLDLPGSTRPSPAEFHRLDLQAWPELVDLCFTYSRDSEALFAERPVRTPAMVEMYASPPGQKLVFHRYKRTHVARAGNTFSLYQSMFDHVHGFELWYELDAESHDVVSARALTPRLPYMGICEEPQQRIRDMVGVRVGPDWPGVVRARLGGRRGCFQLTDLSTDLFRLLTVG
jgi:hypothetical protein